MKPNLNRPIDIIETMRRISIEALGKFAFGYKFGVRVGKYFCIFFL
jgi:hypothetical protein